MLSFPPAFPPRPYTPPSPHPYTPHAQSISCFSILSPAQYWVRSTNHLAHNTRQNFEPQSSIISFCSRHILSVTILSAYSDALLKHTPETVDCMTPWSEVLLVNGQPINQSQIPCLLWDPGLNYRNHKNLNWIVHGARLTQSTLIISYHLR